MIRNTQTIKEIWLKRDYATDGIIELGHKYVLWMQNKNMALRTILLRKYYLGYFLAWCEEQEITYLQDLNTKKIEKYQHHLSHSPSSRSENGILSTISCHSYMRAVKIFIRWLLRKEYLKADITDDIHLKKIPSKLPKILTTTEIERMINVPDVTTQLGIRNRVILEVLYTTGIRASELMDLSMYDVDCEQEIMVIRKGKGGNDRIVPIGSRACHWIKKYLEEVRPHLTKNRDETALFLTQQKKRFMSTSSVITIVRNCQKAANIKIKGACHIFRHAMAVQMLSNGASTRYIQEILGHKRLSTTQIYTRIAIDDLKRIHSKYHPAENEEE